VLITTSIAFAQKTLNMRRDRRVAFEGRGITKFTPDGKNRYRQRWCCGGWVAFSAARDWPVPFPVTARAMAWRPAAAAQGPGHRRAGPVVRQWFVSGARYL
jgi:hypothetical protein